MESKLWYIFSQDVVKGPFTTSYILECITKKNIADESLIWWKGQANWISIMDWKKNLKNIHTDIVNSKNNSIWYVENNGYQLGPFEYKDLKDFLKKENIASLCKLWTQGLNDWKRVHELPDILEDLDVIKRKFDRAPMKGKLDIILKGNKIETQIGTISEGGLGFIDNVKLNTGDIVSVNLKSPLLATQIHSKAKVLYRDSQGLFGLAFLNLLPEAKSTIVSYVNQFK